MHTHTNHFLHNRLCLSHPSSNSKYYHIDIFSVIISPVSSLWSEIERRWILKNAPLCKKEDKKEIKKKEDDKVAAGQVASGNKRVRRFANGFEIEDLKVGPANGKLAKPGKKVVVKYVGKLKNGKVFDQTTGNKTFSFRLGVGEVIKGWDRGVEGMRVGDKRKLVVPPQMGYGATRTGPIPPNSELHFDVELLDVK